MKFVPSFDLGAGIQGYRQANKDIQDDELFPIKKDTAQAALDNQLLDNQYKTSTIDNRIQNTNAQLKFGTADYGRRDQVADASQPGAIARATLGSRAAVIANNGFSDGDLSGLLEARKQTAIAGAATGMINAFGARDRADTVNSTADIQAQIAQANAAGDYTRAPALQALTNDKLAIESGLTADRLANLPDELKVQAARTKYTLDSINAGSYDLQTKGIAGEMARQTFGMTTQYAELLNTLQDPDKLSAYMASRSKEGAALTPQQAQAEIQSKAQNLARSITALQGHMQTLVQNNEVTDSDTAARILQARGAPGTTTTTAPGTSPGNPFTQKTNAAPAAPDATKALMTPPPTEPAPEPKTELDLMGDKAKQLKLHTTELSHVLGAGGIKSGSTFVPFTTEQYQKIRERIDRNQAEENILKFEIKKKKEDQERADAMARFEKIMGAK